MKDLFVGHRNTLGLIIHPVTGELWNSENGPNGGDEINIVKAGKNYGWPTVSMGRSYEGPWQGKFTGDKFPAWRNNAFVGAMRYGEIPNTVHRSTSSSTRRWKRFVGRCC